MPRSNGSHISKGLRPISDAVVEALHRGYRWVSKSDFRTRDPVRDSLTDTQRVERLRSLIGQVASEIEAERSGLQRRYCEECRDAGFLMAMIENDGGSSSSSERLNALTFSILHCERRLDRLSLQSTLLRRFRQSIDQLAADQWLVKRSLEDRAE